MQITERPFLHQVELSILVRERKAQRVTQLSKKYARRLKRFCIMSQSKESQSFTFYIKTENLTDSFFLILQKIVKAKRNEIEGWDHHQSLND